MVLLTFYYLNIKLTLIKVKKMMFILFSLIFDIANFGIYLKRKLRQDFLKIIENIFRSQRRFT